MRSEMMSVDTGHVWLTKDAYNRLKYEIAELLAQRDKGVGEEVEATEQEQRELRIRHLQEVLRSAVVHEPPDDGVAEPGMVLTVRWDDENETETFLMADREGAAVYADLEVCSPRSPLGRSLAGAVPGEQREYRTPDGTPMRVTLVKAVPHRRTG
jgi:transcription elongation factor GreA